MDQPIVGHVEVDNWDGTLLFEQTVKVIEQLPTIQENMRQKVQAFQAAAETTAKLALEAFTKGK